ncbi:hypothetical protein [Jannaschia sp. R86511]|uniref:hypothetical protein n=1 Tax=Jannaschia sp. R86511 TaxID=3093853 RepID=UPI0036D2AC81
MAEQSFRVRRAPDIALALSPVVIGFGVHDVVNGDSGGWAYVGAGVVVALLMLGLLVLARRRAPSGQDPPEPGRQTPGQRVATGVFSLVFFGVSAAMFASDDLTDTTRRGTPVWLLAGAIAVCGVVLVVVAVRGPGRTVRR